MNLSKKYTYYKCTTNTIGGLFGYYYKVDNRDKECMFVFNGEKKQWEPSSFMPYKYDLKVLTEQEMFLEVL